jgi:hypothetical protein
MSIPKEEYPAFYNSYIENVSGAVPDILSKQTATFADFIKNIPESKAGYTYAEGKWTIAEVAGHVIDTERVMAYRALCFARDAGVAQPGFDENIFAQHANYKGRTLISLAEEFQLLRKSNLMLFESFTENALLNRGIANGNPISVRALMYVIAGHLIHHSNILVQRYL